MPTKLEQDARALRADIDGIEKRILAMMGEPVLDEKSNEREVRANIMLAYRAAEDCRMRLGKVIQHIGDGVSVYDKAPEVQS